MKTHGKKTGWLSSLTYFILLLVALYLLVTLYHPKTAQSEVIWQIGDEDGSCAEFISSDQHVIDYQVPPDWASLLNQGTPVWGTFPPFLYPAHDESDNDANATQEVRINFSYPHNYPHALLRVKLSTYSPDASHYLQVFKGRTFIGQKPVRTPHYTFYDFPLRNIQQKLQDENTIIIKNIPNPESTLSYTLPLIFDVISLENNDNDNDGVSDPDEGDDDWDKDGLADNQDQDTVCIPLQSDDPDIVKKIWLNIEKAGNTEEAAEEANEVEEVNEAEEAEEESAADFSFHEVRFLDPDSLNIPDWLWFDRCFPYGFLGFSIEGIEGIAVDPGQEIFLQVSCLIDRFYPSLRCYTYDQASHDWLETACQIVDEHRVAIPLRDGKAGDLDKREDGMITTYLALSYPRSLDREIKKGGCFIGIIAGK